MFTEALAGVGPRRGDGRAALRARSRALAAATKDTVRGERLQATWRAVEAGIVQLEGVYDDAWLGWTLTVLEEAYELPLLLEALAVDHEPVDDAEMPPRPADVPVDRQRPPPPRGRLCGRPTATLDVPPAAYLHRSPSTAGAPLAA